MKKKKCELFLLFVENRKDDRIEWDMTDRRCQYIYCPFDELRYMVCDTRRNIGDYSVTVAMRVATGKPIQCEEIFGKLDDETIKEVESENLKRRLAREKKVNK